jgi:kinesin family protein 11
MNEQQSEAERLRDQMVNANQELSQKNNVSNTRLAALMEEEREQQATERAALMSQISALINSTTKKQQDRVAATLDSVCGDLDQHHELHSRANDVFVTGSQSWSSQAQQLIGKVVDSRESVKAKIKSDFAVSDLRLLSVLPSANSLRLQTRIPTHCVL